MGRVLRLVYDGRCMPVPDRLAPFTLNGLNRPSEAAQVKPSEVKWNSVKVKSSAQSPRLLGTCTTNLEPSCI